MKVKETYDPETVFGDLSRKTIWTDDPLLEPGQTVRITSSICEWEYDSIQKKFNKKLMYAFIVDLELLKMDLSDYVPERSNNGGCYAFADCRVKKIIEKGY